MCRPASRCSDKALEPGLRGRPSVDRVATCPRMGIAFAGSFGFGEMARDVIQRNFGAVGPEAEGPAHGQFRLAVQAFDGPARSGALGLEPVEEERPVAPEDPEHLLRRSEAGAHGPGTPAIVEMARPGGPVVGSEALGSLAEEGLRRETRLV